MRALKVRISGELLLEMCGIQKAKKIEVHAAWMDEQNTLTVMFAGDDPRLPTKRLELSLETMPGRYYRVQADGRIFAPGPGRPVRRLRERGRAVKIPMIPVKDVFDPTGELELTRDWQKVLSMPAGGAYVNKSMGLQVFITGQVELDDSHWIHVSVSRRSRLPSWEDLKLVKCLFIGIEKEAIQVLPAESEYVNVHPFCLHLWHRTDGAMCPDFTHGMGVV
jgi:hypothetical protein